MYIAADYQVHHVRNSRAMKHCNHEEAYTLALVHFLHALERVSLRMLHTGDTDVVVILLSNLNHIKATNPAADIWIFFKAVKTFP